MYFINFNNWWYELIDALFAWEARYMYQDRLDPFRSLRVATLIPTENFLPCNTELSIVSVKTVIEYNQFYNMIQNPKWTNTIETARLYLSLVFAHSIFVIFY